jgi:hypothetical protein
VTYLRPQSEDNSEVAMHTAGVSNTKVKAGDVHDHISYAQFKLTLSGPVFVLTTFGF